MGNAFLLIIVGLLLFYVVISDKFYCIEGCLSCLRDSGVKGNAGGSVGAASAAADIVSGSSVFSFPGFSGGVSGVLGK